MAQSSGPSDAVILAHRCLQLSRLFLQNGAETEAVETAVVRFAAAFGAQVHLLITFESLSVTVVTDDQFRTKVGHRLPALAINVAALDSLERLVNKAEHGLLSLPAIGDALDQLEKQPPEFSRWAVVLAIGVTAGCLARLFGGDWSTAWLALLAGAAALAVRQELTRQGFNLYLAIFGGAFAGGLAGAGAIALGWEADPILALVAPGMILVPGVPLLNGVLDIFRNRVTVGSARLTFGIAITFSIAVGLFLAATVTGRDLPVAQTTRTLPAWSDAFFSGVAALGYMFLFNAPARLALGCLACGLVGHALRTASLHAGVDLVLGSFVGALAVGVIARAFSQRTGAPAVAYAFPGVVAMVPGAFAFRAVSGVLTWVRMGDLTPSPLLAETLSLAAMAFLTVLAIGIGIALPEILKREKKPSPLPAGATRSTPTAGLGSARPRKPPSGRKPFPSR